MTQIFEVKGHPTIPTNTAPTIPAKLVDDFTPTLIDFGEHHLCPGCGEPIAVRQFLETITQLDQVKHAVGVAGLYGPGRTPSLMERPDFTVASIAPEILSRNALISSSVLPETATSFAMMTCAIERLFFSAC